MFPVANFHFRLVFLQLVGNFPASVQRVAPMGRKPQNRPLSYLNTGALRNATGNNIDADPPVHHPFLRHWQLVLKYFRY